MCVCVCVGAHVCSCVFSLVPLFKTPGTVAHQAPLSMEFPKQESWSGLSFPFPGALPHPGFKPASLVSTCIGRQARHQGSPLDFISSDAYCRYWLYCWIEQLKRQCFESVSFLCSFSVFWNPEPLSFYQWVWVIRKDQLAWLDLALLVFPVSAMTEPRVVESVYKKEITYWDFSGSPVVRTVYLHHWESGFDPWSGN